MVKVIEMAQEILQRRYARIRGVHVRQLDGQLLPPEFRVGSKCIKKFISRGWSYGHSVNGWTDDEHALKWLRFFEERTRPEEFKRSARADRIQELTVSATLLDSATVH